jgi:hypothetical protein
MTDQILNLWRSHFPSWPQELIDKFPLEIELQAYIFDISIGSQYQDFYIQKCVPQKYFAIGTPSPGSRVGFSFNIFSPSNQQFKINQTVDFGNRWYYTNTVPTSSLFGMPSPNFVNQLVSLSTDGYYQAFDSTYFSPIVTFSWDSRLIKSPLLSSALVFYKDLGYNTFINTMYGPVNGRLIFPPDVRFSFNNPIMPYNALESIIALHENGIDMQGINYPRLYDFRSYFNAYTKYATQIEGNARLSKQNSAADLFNYQRQLSDQLASEESALTNLQIQLKNATENESRSAMRDLQAMALNAQNLKLNLMQAIKK